MFELYTGLFCFYPPHGSTERLLFPGEGSTFTLKPTAPQAHRLLVCTFYLIILFCCEYIVHAISLSFFLLLLLAAAVTICHHLYLQGALSETFTFA